MEPSPKKARLGKLIRLCDRFTRTELDVICPVIKAENSVRVLYKLQEELLREAIENTGKEIGLTLQKIDWVSPPTMREIEGNLFIEFTGPQPKDEDDWNRFRERLESRLTNISKVKYILVDKVQDRSQIIPQPIISEFDFEMHKLKQCSEELENISEKSEERADLYIVADIMKSELEELTKNYTKFAVLSQNGKGKSYILNMLMLMTADNKEEYVENNKDVKVPKDFPDNTLLENLTETDRLKLPVVVKEFIKTVEDQKKDFKNVLQPVCNQLHYDTNIETSPNSRSSIGSYFSKRARFDIEPYILSQKEIERSYESTTKCVIHLRYGTLYQMKVDYFNDVDLRQQLFELFTKQDYSDNTNEHEDIKDKAQECLEARYDILTDKKFSETDMNKLRTYEDIPLSNEVLKFAGKTELYFGLGKNSTHDRLALQSALRKLTNPPEEDENKADEIKRRIAAVKQIVVYLPSKILHGGKEILEMPGTDNSDPIAMNFIRKALSEVNAVILITENGFKLCGKEVKDILFDSKFPQTYKNDPDSGKLMLLTYPEKNLKWQFGIGDKVKIQKLEQEGKKKRAEELKAVGKMLKKDSLSIAQEDDIFTSYLLPVLHTSILAQKGAEYEVITEYEDFLKHTGINNLIVHLDELVLSRQQSSFEEVKTQLSSFQKEINDAISTEDARKIVQMLSNKSYKIMYEEELTRRVEQLEIELRKKLKSMLSKDVESLVCLFNILFDDVEKEKEKIFTKISCWINDLLDDYKNKAIEQYTKELNTLLINLGGEAIVSSGFVKEVIEQDLTYALSWYLGKKKRPFNMKTMEKFMDKSQKYSLKKIILEPNFNRNSLEESIINTTRDIEKCFMQVKINFILHLTKLHEERFKNLCGKLWIRNKSSRSWQQLVSHMKTISRESDRDNHKKTIDQLNRKMSASFN
ncbi:uncharacterized protein LOC142136854 isoform X2 [Mixophyes fleayi]|uniref:uncharacterized protein LOC142136854 isoform X2 n=1 Tax=Mixophyes fleayi TaxID=3061075 RepID=UPI003F4D97B0